MAQKQQTFVRIAIDYENQITQSHMVRGVLLYDPAWLFLEQ